MWSSGLTLTRVSQLGGDLRDLVVVNKSTQHHQSRDVGALTLMVRKCSEHLEFSHGSWLVFFVWLSLVLPAIMCRVAEKRGKVNESCAVGVVASVQKPGL